MRKIILIVAMLFASTTVGLGQKVGYGHETSNFNITEKMVIDAKTWSEWLLKISKTHADGGDYKKVAA